MSIYPKFAPKFTKLSRTIFPLLDIWIPPLNAIEETPIQLRKWGRRFSQHWIIAPLRTKNRNTRCVLQASRVGASGVEQRLQALSKLSNTNEFLLILQSSEKSHRFIKNFLRTIYLSDVWGFTLKIATSLWTVVVGTLH